MIQRNNPSAQTSTKKTPHHRNGERRHKHWLKNNTSQVENNVAKILSPQELIFEAEKLDAARGSAIEEKDYRQFGTYTLINRSGLFSSIKVDDLTSGESIVNWYMFGKSGGQCQGGLQHDPRKAKESISSKYGYTCQTDSSEVYPLLPEDRRAQSKIHHQAIAHLTSKQKLTMMACIHSLMYWLGTQSGAVRFVQGFDRKSPKMLPVERLAMKTLNEKSWSLKTSLAGTESFLRQYWADLGTPCSKQSARRAIDMLRDEGLLDYHSEIRLGVWGAAREYTYIDVSGLLLRAEALEMQLGGFEVVGDRCSVLPAMFNSLFVGWGWGRVGGMEDAMEPDTWETTDEVRDWVSWRHKSDEGRKYVSEPDDEGMPPSELVASIRRSLARAKQSARCTAETLELMASHLEWAVRQSSWVLLLDGDAIAC